MEGTLAECLLSPYHGAVTGEAQSTLRAGEADELCAFLQGLGLSKHADLLSEQKIDLELLRELSQNDIERNLRREGIPLGDCIKIARGSKTWPRLS